MPERLNREIRRRTGVVGIFPNEESYARLVAMHLIEYPEDWSVTRGGYLSRDALRPLSDKMVQRRTDVFGTKMFLRTCIDSSGERL